MRKFRSLLRKEKTSSADSTVFQLTNIYRINKLPENDATDPDLLSLIDKFDSVFREYLSDKLPLVRGIYHKVKIRPDSNPPHRPILHLSPAELHATKEYDTDLLRKEKMRSRKSPYGAPHFFVKQKDK